MSKRIISIAITDPHERGLVRAYLEKAEAAMRQQEALQNSITEGGKELMMELDRRHKIPADVDMYLDTSKFEDHGLIFFESVRHAEGAQLEPAADGAGVTRGRLN